jgi:hypothetical protein
MVFFRSQCLERFQLINVYQAVLATTLAQVTRGAGQAYLSTTSCPSKTSTVQVNSMCPGLGTLLTLYSGVGATQLEL